MKKFLIIDGSSIFYRAFYAMPPLTARIQFEILHVACDKNGLGIPNPLCIHSCCLTNEHIRIRISNMSLLSVQILHDGIGNGQYAHPAEIHEQHHQQLGKPR